MSSERHRVRIPRVEDFAVDGAGGNAVWNQAEWLDLRPIDGGGYRSRCKVLWSERGLYLLYDCEDRRLSCTAMGDWDHIYREDVVEVFLQPDPEQGLYFEYELSPLGAELPILIANDGSRFRGWRPWAWSLPVTQRRVVVRGGPAEPGAAIAGWTAEFMLPFGCMDGLRGAPPRAGSVWRGNFYRIDYDGGAGRHWAWSPPPKPQFHHMPSFGELEFV